MNYYEKCLEALKTLEKTLETYKKNKTLVDPEKLRTCYAARFNELKQKLQSDAIHFLDILLFENVKFSKKNCNKVVDEITTFWKENDFSREMGDALFVNFNLNDFLEMACKAKLKVSTIYAELELETTSILSNMEEYSWNN